MLATDHWAIFQSFIQSPLLKLSEIYTMSTECKMTARNLISQGNKNRLSDQDCP